MKRTSLEQIPCSIARALDVVGEWWTPLVLRDLFYGLTRFDEIVSDLPISRNILTDRLRTLEAEEIVERRLYATSPERHDYHLTVKGEALFGWLMTLMAWGDRWQNPDGVAPVSVLCRTCETETTAQVCCATCGSELRPDSVGVRPNLGQRTPRPRLTLRRAEQA